MTLFRAITVAFTVGAISLSGASRAQSQDVSLQAELLKDWTALKATMHKIAAEMPADGYDFRPTPAQQTFGERVVHVAAVNVGLLGALGDPTIAKPAIDPKATTRDAALRALDDSFDYGIALLKAQSDRALLQLAPSSPQFLGLSSRARIIGFLVGHTWDTYGQMAVYLRLKGRVPPASQRM